LIARPAGTRGSPGDWRQVPGHQSAADFREPIRCGPVTKFLLWCGAVDRNELATRSEAYRYANLGLLVCGVATLGAATFAIFTSVVLGHFSPAIIPAALGWGLIIFTIDRTIVAEPVYRERAAHRLFVRLRAERTAPRPDAPVTVNGSKPAAELVHHAVTADEMAPTRMVGARIVRGGVYLIRVAITACLAFLIADGLLLLLFRPEVTQQLAILHGDQFQQQAAAFVRGQQGTVRTLSGTLSTAVVAASQQATKVDQDRTALREEAYGEGPDHLAGIGQLYWDDRSILAHDTTRLNQLNGEVTADAAALQGEQNFLTELSDSDPAALSNPRAHALAGQRAAIYIDNGFDEQEKAFSAFLGKDKGDPVATLAPWALRVILICFDLLPLGAKLLNPYTIYGRRMSEKAVLIRYHDLAWLKTRLRSVDHRASLDTLTTRDDYELSATDVGWRRSWGMRYFSDLR
jgi:hypothetical protein